MELKAYIYWLLSILALAFCLSYASSIDEEINDPPLSLTSLFKVNPNTFYYIDNKFNAVVFGQLRLDIKAKQITPNLINYNALVMADYHHNQNTEISLNWRVNDQPHQLMLNQNQLSINPIDFLSKDVSEITDLHLLIRSKQEIGIDTNLKAEVSFQSMQLDYLHNYNQLETNLSEWSDFNPIKLSSINGYTHDSDLQFKGLIIRLSSWLIVSVLLFLVLRIKGTHLIISLFLAWIISSYFFISNHIKQHQQINKTFSMEQPYINQLDLDSHELAQQIKTTIKSLSVPLVITDPMVLFGSNSFFKLRLMHYLMPLNMGMSVKLKALVSDPAKTKYNLLFVEKQLRYCRRFKMYDWLNTQVDLIHLDEKFCLLRKK